MAVKIRGKQLNLNLYFDLYQIYITFYNVLDDKFILSYLRGCKFSYEKTKKKIDMWHAMRFHCPEYFSGWDPLEKKNDEILSQGYEYMNIYI